ncbi:MAG: hypothetical protein IJ641_03700, partial [Lachnospiraceae bacterium]|nr:hypothetical protein [Lachnospiraceae bacterium]
MDLLYSFFEAIPNVVWAVLLLVVAWIAASICRNIVKKIMRRFFERNSASTPMEVKASSAGTIEIVGNLVFAVIFFLFLPGALEHLGMYSVTEPITTTVTKFLTFLPNIIAAIILIAFGIF